MANNSNSTQSNIVQEGQQIKSTVGRSSLFNEFFWICSGANRHILRQCPTEYSKYFGIGGTIFFTAAMATLSGGYAFYTIFRNQWIAIAFGIFWGLLIFNLDRFIVNTMYSDGKHTISWGELVAGTPRLIIAIFLGVVISTPLELKIFEDEINIEIDQMKQERKAEYLKSDKSLLAEKQSQKSKLVIRIDEIQQSSQSQMYAGSLQMNNEERERLQLQVDGFQKQYNAANANVSSLRRQLENTTDSLSQVRLKVQIANTNRQMKELSKNIETINSKMNDSYASDRDIIGRATSQKEQQIKECTDEIKVLDSEIAELKNSIQNASKAYERKLDKEFKGFQAHMLAFDKIKDKNKSTRVVSIFIMLMFIIIEVAPTFFKMMIAAGPYDELLNEEMHRKKVHSIQAVSNLNAEVNTQIQIKTEKEQQRLQAELAANKQLLEKIASVQAELLETAVEEWRKAELKKIKTDPSKYIQSNTVQKS